MRNFQIPTTAHSEVREMLKKDTQEDQLTPRQSVTIVAGDWNYLAKGDSVIKMRKIAKDEGAKAGLEIAIDDEDFEDDNQEGPQRAIVSRRPGQAFWDKMHEEFVDCDPGCPIRWNTAKQTLTRLDRIYLSTPSWLLADPATLARRGGGDDDPVAVTFARKRDNWRSC